MRRARLKCSRHCIAPALLLASAAFADAPASPRNRIAEALNPADNIVLRGSVQPLAQARYEIGRIEGDTVLHGVSLYFGPSQAQQADLEELLRQQQDPLSPNYRAWLTPQQYASRFGLSAADQDRIKNWLRSQGFSIDSVSASGNRISFSGSVARVETAFQTELHRFNVGGESHFANATELSVPASLSGLLLSVRGLDDFRPKPRFRPASPNFTSSISGNHFLAPDDFATIYDLKPLYTAAITGSGRKIAVVGQTPINLGDIRAFRSAAGLPASDPVLVPLPDSGSFTVSNGSEDMAESDIDIEWSGGLAPDATIEFIYAGSSKQVFDALSYAIEQNLAPVVSTSYGDCEASVSSQISTFQSLFQQANAQGQTIVSSSGDAGAADCDSAGSATASGGLAVDFPASSPNVTGVGGTEFDDNNSYWSTSNNSSNGSALSYIPEIAWNDTGKQNGTDTVIGLSASGGGKSTQFSKPSWQTGVGVAQDGARDVPDVALPASAFHDQYLYCTTDSTGHGTCVNGFRNNDADTTLTAGGGTSFGAPSFAGVLALVAQKAGVSGGLGNVNPRLYQLAASTTDVFHDITSGDNKVPTSSGGCIGYTAAAGYDPVTGLGSMDVDKLAAAWASSGADGSVAASAASSSSSGGNSSACGNSSSSSSGSGSSGGSSSGGGGAVAPGSILLLASMVLLRRGRRRV